MKIKTIAPWFGSNRMLARRVGETLGKLAWCGVPFCGGMPELPHIQARGGVANDLHRHVINLARCIADAELKAEMVQYLDGMLFHPDELKNAQSICELREMGLFIDAGTRGGNAQPHWAAAYFTACWMGRGGHAGRRGEFNQSLAMRWTASGGGSAKRFQSAVESLEAWHQCLKRWEFSCLDAFEFIDSVKDRDGHGLYVDAPWPDAGDDYEHRFGEAQQRRLAGRLGSFKCCRVVIRYGDHPLIRELYPQTQWRWIEQTSRDQKNGSVSEVLIVSPH